MKKYECVGVINPDGDIRSLVWWGQVTPQHQEHEAWMRFFCDNDWKARHALPLATAIEAYTAIGFRADLLVASSLKNVTLRDLQTGNI